MCVCVAPYSYPLLLLVVGVFVASAAVSAVDPAVSRLPESLPCTPRCQPQLAPVTCNSNGTISQLGGRNGGQEGRGKTETKMRVGEKESATPRQRQASGIDPGKERAIHTQRDERKEKERERPPQSHRQNPGRRKQPWLPGRDCRRQTTNPVAHSEENKKGEGERPSHVRSDKERSCKEGSGESSSEEVRPAAEKVERKRGRPEGRSRHRCMWRPASPSPGPETLRRFLFPVLLLLKMCSKS
jgi:hypothetical protein